MSSGAERRWRRPWAGVVVALAASTAARAATAGPQGTVGLTIGAAGVSPDTATIRPHVDPPRGFWKETDFHLGLRGDVLFFRQKNSDFGLGPYAELMTHGFDQVQFGGGGSPLLPVLDTLPIVLSGGGYARKA